MWMNIALNELISHVFFGLYQQHKMVHTFYIDKLLTIEFSDVIERVLCAQEEEVEEEEEWEVVVRNQIE